MIDKLILIIFNIPCRTMSCKFNQDSLKISKSQQGTVLEKGKGKSGAGPSVNSKGFLKIPL